MNIGETASFWIREDYGYGPQGCPGQGSAPDIEPETDLEFEITLVSIGEIADNLSKAAEREVILITIITTTSNSTSTSRRSRRNCGSNARQTSQPPPTHLPTTDRHIGTIG